MVPKILIIIVHINKNIQHTMTRTQRHHSDVSEKDAHKRSHKQKLTPSAQLKHSVNRMNAFMASFDKSGVVAPLLPTAKLLRSKDVCIIALRGGGGDNHVSCELTDERDGRLRAILSHKNNTIKKLTTSFHHVAS